MRVAGGRGKAGEREARGRGKAGEGKARGRSTFRCISPITPPHNITHNTTHNIPPVPCITHIPPIYHPYYPPTHISPILPTCMVASRSTVSMVGWRDTPPVTRLKSMALFTWQGERGQRERPGGKGG